MARSPFILSITRNCLAHGNKFTPTDNPNGNWKAFWYLTRRYLNCYAACITDPILSMYTIGIQLLLPPRWPISAHSINTFLALFRFSRFTTSVTRVFTAKPTAYAKAF